MNRRKGFTLIEILIGLCILTVLITLSFLGYRFCINKAQSVEAITTVEQISRAEETRKIETGSYVAADNTQQVNELLQMAIVLKDYEYRVVGVTDENFIVIAQKIGLDIRDGRIPEASMVLAMDRSGMMTSGYQPYINNGGAGAGQVPVNPSSSGGFGGGSGMGGGSGSGGGSGGGSSGGSSGGGSSGGSASDGGTAPNVFHHTHPIYDSDLDAALALLQGSAAGAYYFNLINDNHIQYTFGVLDGDTLGQWNGVRITINENLKTLYPESAIAAVLAHEATHIDYEMFAEKWIAKTLADHPELTRSDLHIDVPPGNSLDQEYHCFESGVLVWRETKQEGDICDSMSANDAAYAQGEAYFKTEIWNAYKDIPVSQGGLQYEF